MEQYVSTDPSTGLPTWTDVKELLTDDGHCLISNSNGSIFHVNITNSKAKNNTNLKVLVKGSGRAEQVIAGKTINQSQGLSRIPKSTRMIFYF